MTEGRPDEGAVDLAAVAADDALVESLRAGTHDPADPLAAALARWSEASDAPVPEVPVAVPTHRRRPRGARAVGLVASVGLIFASGVGQAVAEDPAAPLRFVVDHGVSLGERLVGGTPSIDDSAPQVPVPTRSADRPSLPDVVVSDASGTASGADAGPGPGGSPRPSRGPRTLIAALVAGQDDQSLTVPPGQTLEAAGQQPVAGPVDAPPPAVSVPPVAFAPPSATVPVPRQPSSRPSRPARPTIAPTPSETSTPSPTPTPSDPATTVTPPPTSPEPGGTATPADPTEPTDGGPSATEPDETSGSSAPGE